MNQINLSKVMLMLVTVVIFACGGKKEEHHKHEEGNEKQIAWKEMDDFHMVMAEAFHPYKDSANLEPAKKMAQELFASADKWASSPLPQKVDNDEMRTKLQRLKSDTEAFKDKVTTSDDKTISDDLTKLHDLFHEIQEEWYGEKHEHQH